MRCAWLLLCGGCQLVFTLEPPAPTDAPPSDGPPPGVEPACSKDPALIACYDFDGDVLDGATRNNDPRVTGVLDFDAGVSGKALRVTPMLRLDLDEPNFAGDALTIEAFVQAEQTDGEQLIIDHEGRWKLGISETGNVVCYVASGSNVVTEASVDLGRWHHIACTQQPLPSSVSVTIFIDGVRAIAQSTSHFDTSRSVAAIGSEAPGDVLPASHLDGLLDRLRIWNLVRTDAEILQEAQRAPAP